MVTDIQQATNDESMNGIPQKRCTGPCGRTLPNTTDYFYRDKRNRKHLLCAKCKKCHGLYRKKKHEDVQRYTEQANGHSIFMTVGSFDECGSCGTTSGNIIADVNDTTHEKYGYLCMRCYKLVHDFGEDPRRMRRAIDYVEKTRFSRVAHKKKPATD